MRQHVLRLVAVASLAGAAAGQTQAQVPDGTGAARRPLRPSCAAAESLETVAAVSERGEIGLRSGRLVKLSGLRPAAGNGGAAARAWLRSRIGQPVRVAAWPGEDRWGRTRARVALAEGPSRLDLAQGLVEAGLGVVDVGEAEVLCQPELLALEETARERGLGLWADDRYKPVSADRPERLRDAVGRFTLVEGLVRSVGERRQRTYLNFEADGAAGFTVTIPKRTWAIMVEKGLSAGALRGRHVRVRGIVEEWRGFAIEVTAADMIEVLGRERRRR